MSQCKENREIWHLGQIVCKDLVNPRPVEIPPFSSLMYFRPKQPTKPASHPPPPRPIKNIAALDDEVLPRTNLWLTLLRPEIGLKTIYFSPRESNESAERRQILVGKNYFHFCVEFILGYSNLHASPQLLQGTLTLITHISFPEKIRVCSFLKE